MDIAGKHALITGGTAGLGAALTRCWVAAGGRATICGRSEGPLEAMKAALGDAVHTVRCDVAVAEDRSRLLDEAQGAFGPVDVLVNNAGIQRLMSFAEGSPPAHSIEQEVQINLTAPMLLTAAVLPSMAGRTPTAVVQVTSGLALSPKQSAPVYCATKAGLRAFARSLRWQLADSPVRVVEVLPPLVETAMTAGRGSGKITPDAAAAEILAGLRKDKDEIYVGKAKILRWLVLLAPWLAARITKRW